MVCYIQLHGGVKIENQLKALGAKTFSLKASSVALSVQTLILGFSFIGLQLMQTEQVHAKPDENTSIPVQTRMVDEATETTTSLTADYTALPSELVVSLEETSEATEVELPSTYEDMLRLDLAQPSGIDPEFWDSWISDSYSSIVPSLADFEESGINAAWVVAVIYAECGRTARVVGSNNIFNFTVDTRSYTNFSSMPDCMEYAREWMLQSYFNREWHETRPAGYCQLTDDSPVTIERVNEHYAINPDGSVNWHWSEVVAEVMVEIYESYSNWLMEVG